MFQGLGIAEARLLEIIRPGEALTVTDAWRTIGGDHKTIRNSMTSLARKGFVQTLPGPVFAIGVGCNAIAPATVARPYQWGAVTAPPDACVSRTPCVSRRASHPRPSPPPCMSRMPRRICARRRGRADRHGRWRSPRRCLEASGSI
jgi:hypothetical protein